MDKEELLKAVEILTERDIINLPGIEWEPKYSSVSENAEVMRIWDMKAPMNAGVYFVTLIEADYPYLLYVGQSQNIYKRWKKHHLAETINDLVTNKKKRIIISWFLTPHYQWLEILLINKFEPVANIHGLEATRKRKWG